MRFYIKDWTKPWAGQHKNVKYPCFILVNNGWDDFDYKTLFRLYFCESKYDLSSRNIIGDLKILHDSEFETFNIIPKEFDSLSDQFCSIGQSIDYYRLFYNLDDNNTEIDFKEILIRLNDIIYNDDIYNIFKSHTGLSKSLLRNSEVQRILDDKDSIKEDINYKGNREFNFEYSNVLNDKSNEITVNFDFSQTNDSIPNRINVIVGKNGTGKTSFVSKMCNDFSNGIKENFKNNNVPLFSKVIAISYSVFDDFFKPIEKSMYNISLEKLYFLLELIDNEIEILSMEDKIIETLSKINTDLTNIKHNLNNLHSKPNIYDYKYQESLNYIFCGVKDDLNFDIDKYIDAKFNKSIKEINKKNRIDVYNKIISELINNQDEEIKEFANLKQYSSGEQILISIITEVISCIEMESLIIFDEPEIHLHPNAISNLMRMLNLLLKEFNSYAILITHSPIIIQEIPSQYIHIFERNDNITRSLKVNQEHFGDNITNIINNIFNVSSEESNFKSIMKKIYYEFKNELPPYADTDYISLIENMFMDSKLNLNAKIFLNNLIRLEESES